MRSNIIMGCFILICFIVVGVIMQKNMRTEVDGGGFYVEDSTTDSVDQG